MCVCVRCLLRVCASEVFTACVCVCEVFTACVRV